MEKIQKNTTKPDKMFLSASTAFLALFIIARLVLKEIELPLLVKVGISILAVLSFVYFLIQYIQRVRRLDELDRRIQLEALAIAFPLTMVLLMTLGLLELFISLPAEDFSYRHVWAFLPLFYFIGLTIAQRRYR